MGTTHPSPPVCNNSLVLVTAFKVIQGQEEVKFFFHLPTSSATPNISSAEVHIDNTHTHVKTCAFTFCLNLSCFGFQPNFLAMSLTTGLKIPLLSKIIPCVGNYSCHTIQKPSKHSHLP